ncbi:MAG: TerD family protein [Spirochaetaceae bacterium]|jgi:stress response protein SCP2|nr:TerD family protein [Spirochaetaceae bacterium]
MSINLQKGQRIDLSKDDGGALGRIVVGLGWDVAKKGADIDCDASAILCGADGKTNGLGDTIYFGNLTHPSKAIEHTGDNLTGAGEGDDEQIIVDLKKLPAQYEKVVFVVNIYKGSERNQHFDLIQNAFIRIVDKDNGKEISKYNLSETYPGMTAMIFGEIYRHNGKWKFSAIGQPVQASYIAELVKLYS